MHSSVRRKNIPASEFKDPFRPTTGKTALALFNILGVSVGVRGARFLDLFSGSGRIAIMAAEQGAASVVAVESDRERASRIGSRFEKISGTETKCLCSDVKRALLTFARGGQLFDIIFADPPYSAGWSKTLPALVAESGALARGGCFILEHAARDERASFASGIGLRGEKRYGDTVLSIYERADTGEAREN
ncbi:methyltransferase small [Synergistales bacterium]|nr:methyltransferase small [Synergistales bacterium]